MNIRDIFDTKIHERIEAVVKVADRDPVLLINELKNLVVTPNGSGILRIYWRRMPKPLTARMNATLASGLAVFSALVSRC